MNTSGLEPALRSRLLSVAQASKAFAQREYCENLRRCCSPYLSAFRHPLLFFARLGEQA